MMSGYDVLAERWQRNGRGLGNELFHTLLSKLKLYLGLIMAQHSSRA